MLYTITNSSIFTGGRVINANIIVENDRILEISQAVKGEIITGNPKWLILPSFIDIHTHLRSPGYNPNINMNTETLAARRGGYQLVCTMANSKPILDNLGIIQELDFDITSNANVNVKYYGALTKGLKSEELVDFRSLNFKVVGFSDDGYGVDNPKIMQQIFEITDKLDNLIVMHPQKTISQKQTVIAQNSPLLKKWGYHGLNNVNESDMLKDHLAEMVKWPHVRYHATHISTRESVGIIKSYKQYYNNLTCDVTPHHLFLDMTSITKNNGYFKVNPPLRTLQDRKVLVENLQNGTIDCVATDHAPHPSTYKTTTLSDSKPGFINLETMIPLLYTKLVVPGLIDIKRLVEITSTKPAEIIRYRNVELKKNQIANFVVLDIQKYRTVDVDNFASGGKNSPFIGEHLTGWVKFNIFNGEIFNNIY